MQDCSFEKGGLTCSPVHYPCVTAAPLLPILPSFHICKLYVDMGVCVDGFGEMGGWIDGLMND